MARQKKQEESGRPTLYRAEMDEQVEKLCKLGATNQEIADFFEVHLDTIQEWLRRHDTFSYSVKKGRIIADSEVASSLYKRAVGYTFEEETYVDGKNVKTVIKEISPEPGAALNWLKNRQPDKWRDKRDIDLRTPEGITASVKWIDVTTEPKTETGDSVSSGQQD